MPQNDNKGRFKKNYTTKVSFEQVAHTYNPSYLQGRDQEDQGFRPAVPDKQFMRPNLKNTHHKKGLLEWLKV
jgi:hypothetical protein